MPRQKRVLTLDGGGVRALSSLLILRKFLCLVNEELTGEATPVPLKDVFDLVAGTSTGGYACHGSGSDLLTDSIAD
jgi:patatin-like phospholipase/acyl hydrolase